MRNDRIPTPLKHRWRRFRYNVLPVISFVVCLGLTLWLWSRQGELPNAVAEVESVRLTVAAGASGKLLPGKKSWTVFDPIERDEVIARLDDELIRTQKETLRVDLDRLQKQLEATKTEFYQDNATRRHDETRERDRLAYEAGRAELEVIGHTLDHDKQASLCQQLEVKLQMLEKNRKFVGELEYQTARTERDEATKLLEKFAKALEGAKSQLAEAKKRRDAFPPLVMAEDDLEKLLAPTRAEIATQHSRIAELDMQIKALEIKAPIGGTICAIYCWPGQFVQAGTPIMTIADETGRFAVAYLRQEQHIQPEPGMLVDVRLREPVGKPEAVRIERVGAQFEEIPLALRRDQKILELGRAVRIELPPQFPARPGELIDVTFRNGVRTSTQ